MIERTGNSANLTFYRERGGPLYISVLESSIDVVEGKLKILPVSTYFLTVLRDGEGEVADFKYEPKRGKGELSPRTVARLVREHVG